MVRLEVLSILCRTRNVLHARLCHTFLCLRPKMHTSNFMALTRLHSSNLLLSWTDSPINQSISDKAINFLYIMIWVISCVVNCLALPLLELKFVQLMGVSLDIKLTIHLFALWHLYVYFFLRCWVRWASHNTIILILLLILHSFTLLRILCFVVWGLDDHRTVFFGLVTTHQVLGVYIVVLLCYKVVWFSPVWLERLDFGLLHIATVWCMLYK